MADRKRINGPHGGTTPIIFGADMTSYLSPELNFDHQEPSKTRRIFLKTGLTPSASGSAYLELQSLRQPVETYLRPQPSFLKITCAVYGPKPLPRSSQFSPHMQISTTVKFAPFATRKRRGYVRDSTEKDLAVHLEAALRAAIMTEKWPKSTIEVIITVLEADELWQGPDRNDIQSSKPGVSENVYSLMSTLSGCITVASAAIVNANIDCIDIVAGGTAALIEEQIDDQSKSSAGNKRPCYQLVTASIIPKQSNVIALCTVGYLPSRDELAEIWLRGNIGSELGSQTMISTLINGAINAATASALVMQDSLRFEEKV